MSESKNVARLHFVQQGVVMQWTFANGREVRFDMREVPGWTDGLFDDVGDLFNMAANHGFKQKIADAAAIVRDPVTGKSATDDEKANAMQSVIDGLIDGRWNSTGGGAQSTDVVYRALQRVYPGKFSTVNEYRDWVKAAAKAQKVSQAAIIAALQSDATLAPIIAEMQQAVAANVKSTLADLLG